MEVCRVRPRPLPAIQRRRFHSSPFGVRRFLVPYPYICHRMALQNVIKINHQTAIYNCLLKSPVTSVKKKKKKKNKKKKKKKDASRGELRKVLWTIEADLADGQLLYISGDPFTLGRWEPEMAVPLSPSTQHPNLWKTEVKVPCGTNFKYNFFIRKDKWPSCDLIWRSGPEFSISIPLFSEQNKKVLVRDSWLTDQSERLPVYSWGSWTEETILAATNPVTAFLSGDDHENLRSCESGYLDLKSSSVDLTVKDESYSSRKDDTSTYSNKGSDFSETFSERDQPVEEPWLLQSSTYFLQFKDNIHDPDKESIESMLERVVCPDKSFQGTENPEARSKLTCLRRELVSTVMLINSSKCTMQRIAVLEDGKLVELLLEPKGIVQCDSVYLGEITALVPGMRGAFVNIGFPRPSLMEIKDHMEPIVFPPFSHMAKEKESNGSVIGKQTEHSDTHDNEPSSDGDIEVCNGSAGFDFQDDPVLLSHEEFEENEIGDDFNVPGVLQGNLNGSAIDYGGEEADFDDYCDGNGQLEGESETVNDFLPVEMKDSHVSQPLHTLKRSVDASRNDNKWAHVRKGTKIIVQVIKEGMGKKSPALSAYPDLKGRFLVLMRSWDGASVSNKIMGTERTRLRIIAKTLQPPGFGLVVRTVAAGHSLEELQKDLKGLLSTWKYIMKKAKSAALAADEGVGDAVPVILHKTMGQTLSVVQDCFNEVLRMVVDSPRTYHEVTDYLQEIAPDLCDRVELYDKKNPIFDEYGIEEEISNMLNNRVPIANGGSLVIEQTEALVSIDVNGGHGMLGKGTSQKKAILDVNLAAAKQIARELRLRDIGGIIVVDFIDMKDDLHKRLVYEEMKKAVERDRSAVNVSELSRHGLMEITRKRVRPSVTFMISEPCTCCHATGRVEALETIFSKIEHEICRLLAKLDQKTDLDNPNSWPRFILKVERVMYTYLTDERAFDPITTGEKTRLALLSSSLKVWLLLEVARGFTRGVFEVIPFTESKKNVQQQQVAFSRLRQTKAGNNIPRRKITLFPVKRKKTGRR